MDSRGGADCVDMASTYYSQGYRKLKSGELAEAEKLFMQALEYDPDNLKALNCLGFILYQLKDYRRGEEICRKAAAVGPDNAYAFKGLGLHCAKNGKLEEGISFIRRAIELTDDFVDAYYDLAVIHFEAGQKEEAIKSLQAGLIHIQSESHREMFNRFLSGLGHPVS